MAVDLIRRGKVAWAASTASAQVFAGIANRKFRILAAVLSSETDTDFTFKTATTAISHDIKVAARSPGGLAANAYGWFETTAGDALNIDPSATITGGADVVALETDG